MIGYALVGSNRIPEAVAYYEALLSLVGAQKVTDPIKGGRIWIVSPDKPMFGVISPFNDQAATIGNGCMVAFQVDSPEMVDRFYAKALELGGTDEGPPGYRDDQQTFYGAYFRDLDGNKLCVYRMAAA